MTNPLIYKELEGVGKDPEKENPELSFSFSGARRLRPIKKPSFEQRCEMHQVGMANVPPRLYEAELTHLWDREAGTYRQELIEFTVRKLSDSPYYKRDLGRPAEVGEAKISLGRMVDRGEFNTLSSYWEAANNIVAISKPQTDPTSENVQQLITRELQRLNKTVRLPAEWQQRTGKQTSLNIEYNDAVAYLSYLRSQDVAHAS